MWQTLERKARFIAQMFRSTVTEREIEDIGDVVLSYGEVKALASGNPKLLGHATAAAEVKRLRVLRSVHAQSVNAANRSAADSASQALAARRRAASLAEALEQVQDTSTDDVDVTANGPLGRFAQSVRARRPAPTSWRTGVWRGLDLACVERGRARPRYGADDTKVLPLPKVIALTVRHRYEDIGTVTLDRKVLRAGDAAAAAHLHDALGEFAAGLPAAIARAQADADAHARNAAAADLAVAGARFEHEEALAAAVARLACLTEQIEQEAAAAHSPVPTDRVAESVAA